MNDQADEQGIRDAVGHYVEGMRTGHVETLAQAFHEQAILCGYLGDHLIAGPIAELYAWVAANPAPAATGEPFTCVVIDHFHLLKVEGRWSIVSKLWDAEP